MQKKLTVKEILACKGNKKLSEVYTHNAREAEACELAGIQMIISSENNDTKSIRHAAQNTFLTIGYLIILILIGMGLDLFSFIKFVFSSVLFLIKANSV